MHDEKLTVDVDDPTSAPKRRCSNCGASPVALQGEHHYCPRCGQRADIGRLTLSELASALGEHLLPGGRGFLHTMLALLRSPGRVVREYLAGRRRTYVNPFSFLFVATAASLVLFNLVGGFDSDSMRANLTLTLERSQPDLTEAEIARTVDAQVALTQYATALSLLLSLPLTFFLRILFWRTLNLAEALVLALYILGQVFVLDLFTYPLFLFTDDAAFHTSLTQVLYLIVVLWFGATFQKPRWLSSLKTLAAFVLAFAVFIQMVSIGMAVYFRFA